MTDGSERPRPPAPGRNGRWELMGEVGVDGASMAIVELIGIDTYARSPEIPRGARYVQFRDEAMNSGVQFWAGFGDGVYQAWAWIVDYGTDKHPDERVAQVVVTLIDQHGLDEWRSW